MKKHLLKTVLLAVVLLLGTTSTWADSTTASAGSDDNSTPWNHNSGGDPVTYYDDWVTQDYKLSGNGTYTFNLTTTNAATADHNYYGWSLFLGKKGWSNIWDTWLVGTASTGYCWGNGTGTKSATNDYWTKNPTGAGIYSAMNNSTAVVTVTRTSSYIKAVAKVTPESEEPFTIVWSYYYADSESEDATADLYINFAVEYAYVNITSANFESASSVSPTPVYFNDFSSQTDLSIQGDGEFDVDDTPGFGQVFKNAASSSPRTNYLRLPTVFSDFTYENANTEMTIGFWVNAKNAGDPSNYNYAPLFAAYGSAPNPNNGSPMLCLQSRGLMQINNNGWCDFSYAQNVAGKNTVYNDYAWEAGDGNFEKGGNWLNDAKWHYYTLTLTPRNVIIYLDGVVKNKWVLDGNSDGRDILGSIVNGSALSYVALGGNQAWDWDNNDAAFMFDDFVVYDEALTAEQIAQIIADKTPSYSYTVNAVDANNNILKQLATGSNKSGASIDQVYPQFILSGSTLFEAAQTSKAYKKSFTLSSDEQVEAIAYTANTIANVKYFAEGEDAITGNSSDLASASTGKVGGRSVLSANWVTLPAGKWTVYTRTYVGNSGDHTLKVLVGGEEKFTETYAATSGWHTAVAEIEIEQAGALSTEFNGGSSTGIDWLYVVSNNSEQEVVGAIDYSTPYYNQWNTTPLWIHEGETVKYKFINYNHSDVRFENWYLFGATEASENIVIFGPNHSNTGAHATYEPAERSFTSEDLNGATVELTAKLENGTITVTAKTTKADGTKLEDFVYTQTDLGVSKLKLYVSVEKSYLVLLSEEKQLDVNQYGWITFASDNALKFEGIEGLTAYAVTGTNGAAIEKEALTEVPAGTPLLIEGEPNASYLVPAIASANDLNVANLMVRGKGEAVVKNDVNPRYILSLNSKNEIAFKLIGATSPVVAANKAYLQLASEATFAPQFINIIGGTTGIDNLNVDEENAQADGAIYNLAGQRVSKGYKGLVIMNGKKVIIK